MQFLHKEFEDAFDELEHLSQYHIKHLEHLIDSLLLLQIPQPDWLSSVASTFTLLAINLLCFTIKASSFSLSFVSCYLNTID